MKNELLEQLNIKADLKKRKLATQKDEFIKLGNKSYPIKQIKQLLKTFKRNDKWIAFINSEANLKIEYESGIASGSMTFYGFNM